MSRLAALYLFWLAVLLWPTLVVRGYLDGAPLHEALRFVRNLLFDGTFGGSWYLAASIEATALIWFLSPRLSNRTLLVIASLGYVLCCLTTNYRHLFELAQPFYGDVYEGIAVVVPRPQNSVVCGFFWILLGKIVADREWDGRELFRGNHAWLLTLVGIVLVASEYHLVTVLESSAKRDCYLTLPLGVLGIFLLLRRSAIEVPHARLMRDASVVLYCTNGTVAMVCRRGNDLGRTFLSGFDELLIALAVAAAALLVLEWLSRHVRWLRWLRVAL